MRKKEYLFCTWLRFPGIIVCFLVICWACGNAQQKGKTSSEIRNDSLPPTALSLRGNFSDQAELHIDSMQLSIFLKKFPVFRSQAADLKKFYAYRQNRYAWYNEQGLSEQADNLFNQLNNLDREGILISVPYKDSLDKLFNDPLSDRKPDPEIEILLSAEYLFYADKVWRGIPEQQSTALQWYLPRNKLDLPRLMDSLLKDNSASLFSNSYSIRQYNLLKAQLGKYRRLDSAGIGAALTPPQKPLKKNDSAAIVGAVRHRLFLFGDLQTDSSDNHFDDALEAGVKSFQERNGISADGVMGPAFFRALNTPLKENIRRIIVNMERSRWVPAALSGEFFIINIPSFSLLAFENDQILFRMKVVVGRDVHKTVLFNGDLKYVVFSPYWNVPPSILKKEILPAIRKDPHYLARNHMEWNGNSVRQKPGPWNSLGLVKFLFPNSYNIYLHDSPAKSLFNAETRAFSHGCIRVAEPKKLAEFLLRKDPSWNSEKIGTAMHKGKEQYVTLKNPVPVYIAYLTAWVAADGKLNFRNDIYRRDGELEEMLIGK